MREQFNHDVTNREMITYRFLRKNDLFATGRWPLREFSTISPNLTVQTRSLPVNDSLRKDGSPL
jgi:hypothetical protein